MTSCDGNRSCTVWKAALTEKAAILAAYWEGRAPARPPYGEPPQNPRAITVRNNHTPRADHALLHLSRYVTYRAKNIRFDKEGGHPATATTGGTALVAV